MDWKLWGLPESVDGKTFLDVGCWEGQMCVEAMQRGAAKVLGIDACTSPEIVQALAAQPFDFIQMDILSEKAFELPEFDVVLCAGVLYHVESPQALLFRLRRLCKHGGAIFIETTCYNSPEPTMLFHPGDSFDGNPSNWWSPSESCLIAMMTEAGFSDLNVTHRIPGENIGRICVSAHATSDAHNLSLKILPRRPAYMPAAANKGSRRAH